jgi:hypothetical protein
MNMKQGLTMSRIEAILAAYGSDPSRWPEEERDDALQFIADNQQASVLQSAAAELDRLLDSVDVVAPGRSLPDSIMSSLTSQSQRELMDRLLDWLFPVSSRYLAWLWRPAMAVTLPLALGFILGVGSVTSANVNDWESWEEEIYISGISADDTSLTIDMELDP